MRHIYFLLALLCLGSSFLNAQTTYLGSGGAIPDNGPETCFDLTVCNSVTTLGNGGGQITLDFVCLDITHGWVEDLDIFLEAPDGTRIELSTDNGGSGDDYTNTCFSDLGANGAITAGTPPFTGTFVPEGTLNNVNNGQNPNGTWRLCITDDDALISGVLNAWSLVFSGGTECAPINDDCANAIPLPDENPGSCTPTQFSNNLSICSRAKFCRLKI